jgi:hypothetical protein
MDKDNANPTILNVSDLPTRQNRTKKAATGKDSELDLVLRRPEYLSAPFCDVPWGSDDTESDDDGFTIEPIDELEIYGRLFPSLFSTRVRRTGISYLANGTLCIIHKCAVMHTTSTRFSVTVIVHAAHNPEHILYESAENCYS